MSRRYFALKFLLSILCLACAVAGVSAQTITATLNGTVTDQNGALVAGATVKITSQATGLSKSDATDEAGRFTVTFLPPGTYDVIVEKSGFKKLSRANITLEVAQTASVNLSLEVGDAQAVVEVTAEQTPLLITENSGLETTIENKLIEDLPTAERSTLSFINLVPGAIDAGFAQARGEGLNENANAQGPIGSPGNRNFFDSNFAVNGGRSSTNDILLDGVSNTVGDFNGVAISPPQDSVREFKVQSGAYSAEFGRSGGGVVNLVTKPGERKFHGALYEYFQDGSLNANGWQRNRRARADGTAALPRIDLRRNQFGGAIGGPLTLPKLVKREHNTFFFFNYEGRREDNPFSREITLPTGRMKRGDFGELLTGANRTDLQFGAGNPGGAAGSFVPVGALFNPYGSLVTYNRVNAAGMVTGTVQGRPIFAGNNLSALPACAPGARTAACLDPVATRVLALLPDPNVGGLVNNYVFNDTARFTRDIYAGRIDKQISADHSFFARFSYERRFTAEPNFLGSIAANVRQVRDQFGNFTFNDVYTFNSSIVNNFRIGYTRVRAHQIPNSEGYDPTQLGLPAYLRDSAAVLKFPDFASQGAGLQPGEFSNGQIGGAGNNQPRDTWTVADAVTLVRGNQTIRAGGEFRLLRFFAFQFFNPTGTFTFTRGFTNGPVPTDQIHQGTPTVAGSSTASLLLGLPNSGAREAIAPITVFHRYGAVFVQDDWKVRRNLTLNLGLRWDIETGTDETHDLITNFDPTAESHLVGAIPAPADVFTRTLRPNFTALKGLLNFPFQSQTAAQNSRFAPRFGFAYSVNERTTLRGGYGIFFVPLSLEPTTALGTNFSQSIVQSPAANQVTATGIPTVFLNNPFPTGVLGVTGNTLGNNTQLGGSIFAVEPRRDTAYNQQWNIVLQRQLAKNLVLDVGYVGSRAVRLPVQTVNLNQLEPYILDYARANFGLPGTCPTTANPQAACASVVAFFNQQVANPFNGRVANITGSVINPATVTRAQLLKPFPQYNAVSLFRPHIGFSTYHAMQINLQKRFSDGLSMTANYSWSKLLDTGGVGNGAAFLDSTNIDNIYSFPEEYSYSTLDVPRRLVASWSYELPFGKRKKFGSEWSGLTNALLGGWQTSGSYTWQRGTPLQIVVNNTLPLGNAALRPNRAPGNPVPSLSTARQNVRNAGAWFDTSLYTTPANFTFGSAARTYNDLRRDNYRNFNLSAIKNITWAEGRQKIQFRAEFLNAFNQVVFGTPVSNVSVGLPVSTNACFATQTCYGQVRTQGNTPRIIQAVLRYTF
jgi:hypothetical protein